jgi:hypothetical protein
MEQGTTTEPERGLERTGDELEERIEKLDDHIGEAKQEAQARREESDPFEDAAGDTDDDDDNGGQDPAGFDDPEADDTEDED